MAEQIFCMAEVPSFAASKGSVDLQAVHAAVTDLVKAGYTHIIVAGFGGEYENLTCSDRLDLIACAVDAANDKAKIIAGAMDAGTHKAAARIAENTAAGCHMHLCIASHYFSLSNPEELTRHFSTLAKVDGGLIVADSPAHTGFFMPISSLEQISRMDGVAAVYEHAPDSMQLACLQDTLRVTVREELVLLGTQAMGFVSRLALLFPYLMRDPRALSESVRHSLLQLLRADNHPAAAVKHAAHFLALCACGDLLPPAAGLNDAQKLVIQAAASFAQSEELRMRHGQ